MIKPNLIEAIYAATRKLDVEETRKLLDQYFRDRGKLELANIEQYRPSSRVTFFIVGFPPPAKRRSHWHRCSYCETNQKFKAGYLILGGDGRLRLIGLDCWKHHLDEEAFNREKGDYRRYRQHQAFIAVQPRLIEELKSYGPALRIAASRLEFPLRALEGVNRKLSGQAGPVWRVLDRLRKSGSNLTLERPPTEAERRAAELREQPLPRSVTERMGVAEGLELLSSSGVSHEIQPTIDRLNELEAICKLQDWDSADASEIWSRLAQIKRLASAISSAVETVNSLVSTGFRFLDLSNLSRIVGWLNHPHGELEGRGKLSLVRAQLIYEGDDGTLANIPLPSSKVFQPLPEPTKLSQLVQEITR